MCTAVLPTVDPVELAHVYVRAFANAILHGDAAHRAWLLNAAERFLVGLPVSQPA